MRNIKAFFQYPELADNAVGIIAKFGEFSTYSQTFTREVNSFSNTTRFEDVELITLYHADENGNRYVMPDDLANLTLALGQWLYNQHTNGQIPSNSSRNSFINAIKSEFGVMRNVKIGKILDGTQANRKFPEWIEFDTVIDTIEHRMKVWTSDASLRLQYPHYEIFAVPPVRDIMRLNDNTATVKLALETSTATDVIDQANVIIADNPNTRLSTYELTWHDPNNFNSTLKTVWTLIIYGQAGIDSDAIKNAIRIKLNEVSSTAPWDKIYPDLFSENEFIIIPTWDKNAVRSTGNDESLYSSLLNIKYLRDTAERMLPVSYGTNAAIKEYLDDNLQVMSVFYRNIFCIVVGNPNNKDSKTNLKMLYPEYIDAPTYDNPDFARMEVKTQQFVLALNKAIGVARTFTESHVAPTGYVKSIRGNRLYLGFVFEGMTYFVLTKQGFNKQ